MDRPLNIIFMGTPDFVVPLLRAIAGVHHVSAVYTQPPRPKGRSQSEREKSPVHLAADGLDIPVFTPVNFSDPNDVDVFRAHDADIAVVAAYGMLLPQDILDAPKHGCMNVHPSLLPRWRGSAPIQFAIWKGDSETGVSVMKLVKKMDAGPIIAQRRRVINDHDFISLNEALWQDGAQLVLEALKKLQESGTIDAKPQADEGIAFTHMLEKQHGRIDWTQSAQEIERQVRGLNPWPGTWCEMPDGKRLKILKAKATGGTGKPGDILANGNLACGSGALQLLSLQPEGKKPMDVKAALNGGYLKPGDRLP